MEFIPITMKTFQYTSYGPEPLGEISFQSDCTEIKCISNGRFYGHITNIQTYCSQDVRKEKNLIFPTKFIKFFKLLSSSEFGRRFWFDGGCSSGNFVEAGIDTSYDADVGDIFSGDSKLDFMRYIYRDMVVPFTELEKKNKHLREQLQRKDQEIERKDQELAQMKEQLQTKDQELERKDQELERKDQELEEMKEQLKELQEILKTKDQELKTSLLTASTLNEATLHHDRTLFGLTSAIDINCEKLQEKDQKLKNIQEELGNIQEELGNIQEELDTTYQELKELQEDFETKDQELKDAKEELKETQEEVKTRGLLLKSCVEELKTYVEEVEEVEKKNQELEHLNHRLIYETSNFVERNSYFSPEM